MGLARGTVAPANHQLAGTLGWCLREIWAAYGCGKKSNEKSETSQVHFSAMQSWGTKRRPRRYAEAEARRRDPFFCLQVQYCDCNREPGAIWLLFRHTERHALCNAYRDASQVASKPVHKQLYKTRRSRILPRARPLCSAALTLFAPLSETRLCHSFAEEH